MKKSMLSISAVLVVVLSAAVGAFYLLKTKDRAVAPYSMAMCFLAKKTPQVPIVQVDSLSFSTEDLPLDMHESYMQSEMERFSRLEFLYQQLAIRASVEPEKAKKEPRSLTPFIAKDLIVDDAKVQEYYKSNAKAFSNISYEKAAPAIKKLLTSQEQNLATESTLKKLNSENRLHMLAPIPCGPKVPLLLDNYTPGRGNTTSMLQITFVMDYSCQICKHIKPQIERWREENLTELRMWYLILPGAKNSQNDWLARGAHCAFKIDSALYSKYHDLASNFSYDSNMTETAKDPKEVKEKVEVIYKNAGYSVDKMQECLLAQDTLKRMEELRAVPKDAGINTFPAIFINNRRFIPREFSGSLGTLQQILSESIRLKERI